MTTLTRDLAERAAALRLADIPAPVAAWACRAIADVLACGLAGADEPATRLIREALPTAPGDCLVIGARDRRSPFDAALINGVACHALDFDDCHLILDGHPSVALVPALVALAETLGASGAELLTAYVAGIEGGLRLARLSNPAHVARGWHPTATFGAVAAAIGCARLLELDPDATARAIAIAASSASGLRANSGTMTKPLHAGQANRNGLSAAWFAHRGLTANTAALEHKLGFLSAYNGAQAVPADALADWGRVFLLLEPGIAIKQYPCCAFVHCAIDAAAALRPRIAGTPIAAVEVALHPRRMANIDRPRPRDGLDARFSTQYLTARGLLAGTVGFDDFEPPALADAASRALRDRVTLAAHGDADLSRAEVTVTLADGRRLSDAASVAMGRGPANPMSPGEFRAKFDDCARRALPPTRADALFAGLADLAARPSVHALTQLMQQEQS